MRYFSLFAMSIALVLTVAQLLCTSIQYQNCALLDLPNNDPYLTTCINAKDIAAPGIPKGSFFRNISSYKIPPDRMCLFYDHPCNRLPPSRRDVFTDHMHVGFAGSSLQNISERGDGAGGKVESIMCSRRMFQASGKIWYRDVMQWDYRGSYKDEFGQDPSKNKPFQVDWEQSKKDGHYQNDAGEQF